MGGGKGETTISQGGSSYGDGGSRGDGGLAVLAWTIVALLGDVLLCLFTRCCVVLTLGAGGETSGVSGGGTPNLGRDTATLGTGGKPGGGASVVVYWVSMWSWKILASCS